MFKLSSDNASPLNFPRYYDLSLTENVKKSQSEGLVPLWDQISKYYNSNQQAYIIMSKVSKYYNGLKMGFVSLKGRSK